MLFPAVVIVVLFIALALGSVFVWGAPILAIPTFVVVALVIVGALAAGRTVLRRQGQYRRMRAFRKQARAQPEPITAEDRRTVV